MMATTCHLMNIKSKERLAALVVTMELVTLMFVTVGAGIALSSASPASSAHIVPVLISNVSDLSNRRHDFEGTLALSSLLGVAFIVPASLLTHFSYTRKLGSLLLKRLLCTIDNWERETLRSFVELGTWLCVCLATAEATGSWMLALTCATSAGCVVILCGEAATCHCASLERWLRSWWGGDEEPEERMAGLVSGSALVLSVYGYGLLSLIYECLSDILLACCLAGLAAFGLLTCANLVAAWPPTRRAGRLLQARVAPYQTLLNWRKYPLRSATEVCAFLGVTLGVHSSTDSYALAVQAGTLAGITIVLSGEAVTHLAIAPTANGGNERGVLLLAPLIAPLSPASLARLGRRFRPPRLVEPAETLLDLYDTPRFELSGSCAVCSCRLLPPLHPRARPRTSVPRSCVRPSDVLHHILMRCDADTLRVAKACCGAFRAHCRGALTRSLKAEAGRDWAIVREVSEAEGACAMEATRALARLHCHLGATGASMTPGERIVTFADGDRVTRRLSQICVKHPVAFLAALDSWNARHVERALGTPPIVDCLHRLLRRPGGLSTVLKGFEKWRDMNEVADVLEAHLDTLQVAPQTHDPLSCFPAALPKVTPPDPSRRL